MEVVNKQDQSVAHTREKLPKVRFVDLFRVQNKRKSIYFNKKLSKVYCICFYLISFWLFFRLYILYVFINTILTFRLDFVFLIELFSNDWLVFFRLEDPNLLVRIYKKKSTV